MGKIVRFIKEWIKWKLGGSQLRTPQHIGKLYSICKKCPNFEEYAPDCDFGECRLCGCNIKRRGASLNKLAWKTTKCPDNPPRWG